VLDQQRDPVRDEREQPQLVGALADDDNPSTPSQTEN